LVNTFQIQFNMKKNAVELDVDFIGSQDKLTKEEEIALKNYFTKRKEERSGMLKSISKSKKKKVTA
jgi:hypothetical protein